MKIKYWIITTLIFFLFGVGIPAAIKAVFGDEFSPGWVAGVIWSTTFFWWMLYSEERAERHENERR